MYFITEATVTFDSWGFSLIALNISFNNKKNLKTGKYTYILEGDMQ